jgi:putative peptide zinc metalloprotease protein
MDQAANPADLERRKQVRLCLRQDLSIQPQKYEGRTYYVVKDPISMRYYRFKEQEHYLLQFMDGSHTLDEAQKEYEKRFRPERLKLEDLEHFGQQLLTAGLAQNESPRAGKQLYDRRKKRQRREWLQTLTNILYIKIPIFDPERLLGWMLQYVWWIFTPLFLIVSMGVMLSSLLLVATHFDAFRSKLPSYHEFFQLQTVLYLWVALGLVKVIHEFGHGLSCKAFRGEVHEMGALFLVFSPCLYCNVSDAWTLPSKWKRIIISGAGIYVELIIAAIATWVWWNSASHPFVNNLSLSLMVVCSVSTVLFNANPLMRFDGYYVLADWLEIPNLRDRTNRFLKNLVLEYCLGVEVQPETYMATWRKVLFVGYAIISYIYRWVITYVILIFMATFLKPYKLEVISQMLAAAALASMVGWPLFRLGKNLHRRGRLPDMKTGRVVCSATVLAVVLLGFFFLPLPVSRVRETGLVQLQDEASTPVLVRESGQLDRLFVRDGQEVEDGAELAVLTNRDLESQLEGKETDFRIRQAECDTLQQQFARAGDATERTRISVNQAKKEGERAGLAREVEELRRRVKNLTLRAPRAGRVLNPPRIDEIGKSFEIDQPTPFCIIGDPSQLRVVIPLRSADYNLLKEDRQVLSVKGKDLSVTIRVQGRDSHTWEGKLLALPESDAKQIPPALSNRAGGPIAVKPSNDPNQLVPQAQQYLASVVILNSDAAICPGSLAMVKIHCRWQSCAWWVWRSINDTFDLGLV